MEDENNNDQNTIDKESESEEEPKKTWKESYNEWKEFRIKDKELILKGEYFSTIAAKFLLPFVMAFEFALILYLLYPDKLNDLGRLFIFYFFNPAGMEVGVLYGFEFTSLNRYTVVIFMLVIDSLTAIFLIWNFNYSRLLPGFGWFVWLTQSWAKRKMKKSKSFRRGRFWGLILFVMIPAYGTGAILGGIVGKLLNMNPWKQWLAIFIGSSLRLTVMAVAIHFLLELLNI